MNKFLGGKKFDVILVLGVSTDKKLYRTRVERAVELYKKSAAGKVIFSGKYWGKLSKAPSNTEARLMADYGIKLSLPKKDIFIEDKSYDTVGNFYLTKKNILEPNKFKSLAIITNESHVLKAKYIAKKVLGKNYKIKFLEVDAGIDPMDGHSGMEAVKMFFVGIKDGDDEAVLDRMRKVHPYRKLYNRYKIFQDGK